MSNITHFLGTKWAKIMHISANKGGVKKLGHRTAKKKLTPWSGTYQIKSETYQVKSETYKVKKGTYQVMSGKCQVNVRK